MNLQERAVVLLIFMITAAHTEVKIRGLFTSMGSEDILYSRYGFYIPVMIAFALIIMRLCQKEHPRLVSGEALSIWRPLLLWCFAATLSFFWNIGTESVFKYYLGGFVAPLIVYLALRDLPLSKRRFNQIMIALSLGIIAILILGIIVYYRTWGVPGITTLIFSRYDEQRMKIYRQIMFGNLGNAAQLLVFIGPVFLALAMDRSRSWRLRVWFGGCFLLVLANLAIVGARAGFFVIVVAILLICHFYQRLGRFLVIATLVIGVGWLFLPSLSTGGVNLFLERMFNGITLNREADYSVFARIEAMKEGWYVFCNNWPVGVGPGSSYLHISAFSAHQFFIQQGVELGILGLIATVILVPTIFWRLAKVMFFKTVQTFRVERFIFLLGLAMYFLYGVLANLTLNIGVVNIWANLMAAFLALAEFREEEVESGESRNSKSVTSCELRVEEIGESG